MDVLDRAIVFATEKHSGVTRKGCDTPFILHPLEAAAIVATLTDDRNVISAAVLHDTVEDTDATIEDIEQLFGNEIAYLVAGESEDKMTQISAEDSWQIRKQATIDELLACRDIRLKYIAMGDKLSNMRQMVRDYAKNGEKLWDRFNQKDPKKHGWYYDSFRVTLGELKGTPAYEEYCSLLDKMGWYGFYK